MADDAIDYMTRMHQTNPAKPLFIKYAPVPPMRPTTPPRSEWTRSTRCTSLMMATRN